MHPVDALTIAQLVQEATTDTLVKYCEESPEADECRVYED